LKIKTPPDQKSNINFLHHTYKARLISKTELKKFDENVKKYLKSQKRIVYLRD